MHIIFLSKEKNKRHLGLQFWKLQVQNHTPAQSVSGESYFLAKDAASSPNPHMAALRVHMQGALQSPAPLLKRTNPIRLRWLHPKSITPGLLVT